VGEINSKLVAKRKLKDYICNSLIINLNKFIMATKIIYKGKTHYWVNSFSTKAEAETYATKHRKLNNSVIVRKLRTPKKGVGNWRNKTIRYYVYSRSLPQKK
jgi:hypothetical protein